MNETTRTLLSLQEAAQTLGGVSRTTLWRMCQRGDLSTVKIGRRTLVTGASIDTFVRYNTKTAS